MSVHLRHGKMSLLSCTACEVSLCSKNNVLANETVLGTTTECLQGEERREDVLQKDRLVAKGMYHVDDDLFQGSLDSSASIRSSSQWPKASIRWPSANNGTYNPLAHMSVELVALRRLHQ
jgi:hypothetical protein